MFVGLTIAIRLVFRTGMTNLAHPESYVPTIPMSVAFAAYALALAVHLAESHDAACAVESSHDW